MTFSSSLACNAIADLLWLKCLRLCYFSLGGKLTELRRLLSQVGHVAVNAWTVAIGNATYWSVALLLALFDESATSNSCPSHLATVHRHNGCIDACVSLVLHNIQHWTTTATLLSIPNLVSVAGDIEDIWVRIDVCWDGRLWLVDWNFLLHRACLGTLVDSSSLGKDSSRQVVQTRLLCLFSRYVTLGSFFFLFFMAWFLLSWSFGSAPEVLRNSSESRYFWLCLGVVSRLTHTMSYLQLIFGGCIQFFGLFDLNWNFFGYRNGTLIWQISVKLC